MIFVKNSRGGREFNMINTVSKINLSKIGWEGGGSTSIWIMSVNILGFFDGTPKEEVTKNQLVKFAHYFPQNFPPLDLYINWKHPLVCPLV